MTVHVRFTVILMAVLVFSCSDESTPSDLTDAELAAAGKPELPEMAPIAGVQDVWPFGFGLDTTRAEVEKELGAPTAKISRPAGETENTVITWQYEGVDLEFFVAASELGAVPGGDVEFLLSARIHDSALELGAGLHVGMKTDRALGILGEPGFESDDTLVFFYYTTTIELITREGSVNEIVLARALP